MGDKRSAPDAPDNSDDDCFQPEPGKAAEAAGQKLHQAERQRNKKLRRDSEARDVTREERKMTAIMRQIEEMEQTEKAVKAGPCSPQLEGSVGNVNEKVGETRRFHEACDAVAGEAAGQGLRGEGGGAGGEKLENKRMKEAKHTQSSVLGKGKEEAVETRKRPSSEEDHEAQEQQHGELSCSA